MSGARGGDGYTEPDPRDDTEAVPSRVTLRLFDVREEVAPVLRAADNQSAALRALIRDGLRYRREQRGESDVE